MVGWEVLGWSGSVGLVGTWLDGWVGLIGDKKAMGMAWHAIDERATNEYCIIIEGLKGFQVSEV